jgi:hypothetical protein
VARLHDLDEPSRVARVAGEAGDRLAVRPQLGRLGPDARLPGPR